MPFIKNVSKLLVRNTFRKASYLSLIPHKRYSEKAINSDSLDSKPTNSWLHGTEKLSPDHMIEKLNKTSQNHLEIQKLNNLTDEEKVTIFSFITSNPEEKTTPHKRHTALNLLFKSFETVKIWDDIFKILEQAFKKNPFDIVLKDCITLFITKSPDPWAFFHISDEETIITFLTYENNYECFDGLLNAVVTPNTTSFFAIFNKYSIMLCKNENSSRIIIKMLSSGNVTIIKNLINAIISSLNFLLTDQNGIKVLRILTSICDRTQCRRINNKMIRYLKQNLMQFNIEKITCEFFDLLKAQENKKHKGMVVNMITPYINEFAKLKKGSTLLMKMYDMFGSKDKFTQSLLQHNIGGEMVKNKEMRKIVSYLMNKNNILVNNELIWAMNRDLEFKAQVEKMHKMDEEERILYCRKDQVEKLTGI